MASKSPRRWRSMIVPWSTPTPSTAMPPGGAPGAETGRHRPKERHGRAEIDRVHEHVAVHGVRNGLAEVLALEPGPAMVGELRFGAQIDPHQVRVAPDPDVHQLETSRIGGRPERRD